MQEEWTFTDYFALLRRWKKLFLLTTGILFGLSSVFVLCWSNYRATATVQIEQAQISPHTTLPLGATSDSAMESLADQRISEIQQKVEATASLIDIIQKFDLYAGVRRHRPIALVADDMRKKIKLEMVGGNLANPLAGRGSDLSAIAFKVSFDYKTPKLAQQVTEEMVTRFLQEDTAEKHAETLETSTLLADQIAALDKSMSGQEEKIAAYETAHGDLRPENLAFNQQVAATLALDLQTLDAQIVANEGNLGSLRAQLAATDPYSRVIADGQVLTTPLIQLKALQAQYASLNAQYGPEHPDVVRARHQIEALQAQVGSTSNATAQLQAQITDMRANLAAASKTYGADHPDAIALHNQLQHLENQLAMHRPDVGASDGIVGDADNPAYLQLAMQVKAAQEQHKALAQQRKELQAQQENYQKAINANPQTAQEMAALTRDYDNAQLRYRELKEKKMAADMSLQMQLARQGMRLTVVVPPELPLETQPGRKLLMLIGAFISLMGALVSIVIAQNVAQSVIGVSHLQSVTGALPLVAVPHIYTRQERDRSWPHIAQRKFYDLWGSAVQKYGRLRSGV